MPVLSLLSEPAPTPPAPTGVWTFEIWSADGLTQKAVLDPTLGSKIWAPKFRDPFKGIGAGSFNLQNDDTDFANITDGDVVRCYIGTTPVFGWTIKGRTKHTVAKSAGVGVPSGTRYTEFSGLGVKGGGDRSPIRPWRGGQAVPKETVRAFDWTSPLFDFSAWPNATQIARVDSQTTAHWIGSPQFIIDNLINWIAGSDGNDDDAVAGVRLIRAPRFTVETYDQLTRIAGWIDNEGVGYLNGTEIMRIDTFHELRYIDLLLPPGDYDLAWFCRNLDPTPTSETNNPVGLGYGVYEITADGTYVRRIMVSDSTAKVLVLPATTPGLPLGWTLRELLEEAQARGEMAGYRLGCTDTEDSNGNTLPTATDVGAIVNDTFDQYLAALEDAVIDVRVTADKTINIYYPKGSYSTATTVTFTEGTSLEVLDHQMVDDRVTGLFIDYDGGYVEVGTGPYFKPLKLSQVNSEDAAVRIGTEILVGRDTSSIHYIGKVVTGIGREPYDDFTPGDNVLADDPDSVLTSVPAGAFTFEVDKAGKPLWTVEFGDLIEPIDTIAERAVRRFAATRSATNIHSGQPSIKGGGGEVYHQEKVNFTYEPSDLQISQKTPAPVTRDIAYFEVQLDEADSEAHTFTIKVNGSTLTDLITTVAIGADYAVTWAPIPGPRILAGVDKITLEFSGQPIRFAADLVLR